MATLYSSLLTPPNLLSLTTTTPSNSSNHTILNLKPIATHLQPVLKLLPFPTFGTPRHHSRTPSAVAEETAVTSTDPKSEAARRLYVGNIPRTVTNDELAKIVEEHGAVEKAEVFC